MTQVFIGVDGGGTKTRFHCLGGNGSSRGEVTVGCTNWNSVGELTAFENFKSGIDQLIILCKTSPQAVHRICLGMAGVERPQDVEKWEHYVKSLLPNLASIRIVNDAEVALASGTNGVLDGICVISGTGHIVVGFHQGKSCRCAGWGPMLGDQGSGFDIAMMGLRAVTRAHDDNSKTLLTDLILGGLGITTANELIPWAYKDTEWSKFAALSKFVFEAASKGDQKAIQIVQTAAASLFDNIKVVYSKGGFSSTNTVNLVFAGGNLTFENGTGILATKLSDLVMASFPNIKVLFPINDPSVAAAMMAKNFV